MVSLLFFQLTQDFIVPREMTCLQVSCSNTTTASLADRPLHSMSIEGHIIQENNKETAPNMLPTQRVRGGPTFMII